MLSMVAVKFGFPVLTPGGRLGCFGTAQMLLASSDLLQDHFVRVITLTLTPHIAKAALASTGYDEAVADSEAELRDKDFGDGVEFRSISDVTLGDVFKKAPGRGPAIGGAVSAYWQGQHYPATVVEISGDQYRVQWDGHDTWAWLPLAHLQPRA